MQDEPLVGQLLLVNGKACHVQADAVALIWSPAKGRPAAERNQCDNKNKPKAEEDGTDKEKRIPLDHVIGILTRGKLGKTRLKVYYYRQATSRSSRPLLKLKKLNIEAPGQKRAYVDKKVEADPNKAIGLAPIAISSSKAEPAIKETSASEAPPSCYASEGSTSHLSSLSLSGSSQAPSRSPAPQSEGESSSLGSSSTSETGDARRQRPPQSQSGATGSCLERLKLHINKALESRRKRRPTRLLVFVNPYGGKGKASHVYKRQVRPLLDLAQIEATLVVTKYANHARDTIEDPQFNVEHFDGVVCVGGDGMFSELMNGLLFRYNRDKILSAQLHLNKSSAFNSDVAQTDDSSVSTIINDQDKTKLIGSVQHSRRLDYLRSALGGIGNQFQSPPIPIGVIGAGSTDANSFGLIGTNDVITATLNIILGNQIKIDICSVHSIPEDRLERFVSTFVAYGYFGDVIRESEKLRWLGPSRYDVSGVNNLIKNRTYSGRLSILTSGKDGSPLDFDRCHIACERCCASSEDEPPGDLDFSFVERHGSFIGINAAVTACRCPQTKKGFSPNNHLANGCADLILVRPCSRMQYLQYLLRIGWINKSAFDLKYVETYRCRQFEFEASLQRNELNSSASGSSTNSSLDQSSNSSSLDSKRSNETAGGGNTFSSWNVDGEILNEQSIRVKVNNRLLTVFGTGEPR